MSTTALQGGRRNACQSKGSGHRILARCQICQSLMALWPHKIGLVVPKVSCEDCRVQTLNCVFRPQSLICSPPLSHANPLGRGHPVSRTISVQRALNWSALSFHRGRTTCLPTCCFRQEENVQFMRDLVVGLGSRLLLSVNYEAPPGAAASKGARFDHSRPTWDGQAGKNRVRTDRV